MPSDATTRTPAIGWIDEPLAEGIVGPRVRITGWALASRGIRSVEVRLDGRAHEARYGLPRHDVAAVRPGYPDNPHAGFEFDADLSHVPAASRVLRRTLTIVAVARDGSETVLGRRTLVEASAHERWRFLRDAPGTPFHLVPALSGVAAGAAFGLDVRYSAYLSKTARIGMRVPILYLRTTLGASGDYAFDPDFDVTRRNGQRVVVDDALAPVLRHAAQSNLPVLITLNGGIWADAAGSCADWDAIDRLEEDVANCQWNERDEVMPDDWLAHLPGSHASPELARALTLNVYAHDVRRYKRRNLQQAAPHIVAFMHAHPSLFIGVNLDPDVYINPFFGEAQWYDYNPGTLAQFRHWLAGTGPYAGGEAAGVPDLSAHARAQPLSLREVRALARRAFASWEDVDPPRAFPRDPANAYWNDRWVREWETFRRHLVALHYEELAQWLIDAGVPGDRIWSSQGLMAPAHEAMPLALSITSPVKNHDSGGVSIEGSKPRGAHLGAIVYGDAATNRIAMEGERSLHAALAAIDPDFAIVEFNTADLRHPERHPTYADAYRALRDLWNSGARFVSPMAWNGSNGLNADQPGYTSFTAWRNTPLEEAARDFLLARSGLPRGSRLWTFGSQVHVDDDGWANEAGAAAVPLRGALAITADRNGVASIVSPREIALGADTIAAIVIGLVDDVRVETIAIDARSAPASRWIRVAECAGDEPARTPAGCIIACSAPKTAGTVDQLRVTLRAVPGATITLARVAILRAT